jgi:hypothetical protein
MIYEMRVYTLQPGKCGVSALIEKGASVISKYSKLVGWWSRSRIAQRVVHIWAYEDSGHRERCESAGIPNSGVSPQSPAMIVSQL